MKIKAKFTEEFEDGAVISCEPQRGNAYLVDELGFLIPEGKWDFSDFKKGNIFLKVGFTLKESNMGNYATQNEVRKAELLECNFYSEGSLED